MGRKDRCVAFGCKEIYIEVFFLPKKCAYNVNTERGPPRYPIILLKSNKLNMATIPVKRSVKGNYVWEFGKVTS